MHRIGLKLLILLLTSLPAWAQDESTRLPVQFLFSFGNLGSSIELLRPAQVRYDRQFNEFYVVDTGHSRIVILNDRGHTVFEFANPDVLNAPTDIAVDPYGRIYVLGSPVQGKHLQVFDYNGDYLHSFELNSGPLEDSLEIGSLVIDSAGQMFCLDGRESRILSYDLAGNYLSEFPIFAGLEKAQRREQVLSHLVLAQDLIYLPAPMLKTVYCYTKQGSLVKTIGHIGGGYGELSFPISVAVDEQGDVLVLDKHRHTIIGYDAHGKILGEYGGMGTTSGWFYHPIALVLDKRQRLWVTQGLGNLVQVLQFSRPASPLPLLTEKMTLVNP